MFDSSIPFTPEEINLIEGSGLTIAELKDFFSRFPDQNLDTAIGGCLDEKKAKEAGLTPGLEVSHEANPDAPAPAESGAELGEEAQPENKE